MSQETKVLKKIPAQSSIFWLIWETSMFYIADIWENIVVTKLVVLKVGPDIWGDIHSWKLNQSQSGELLFVVVVIVVKYHWECLEIENK